MSDSDSEVEVYIERGDQRESFSPEEGNDAAMAVQKQFCLEEEPKSVFLAKNGNSPTFGKMKPGHIYKLKENEKVSSPKSKEPDIYIEKREKRRNFLPADANDARIVQKAFSLNPEPAFVYSVPTGEASILGKWSQGSHTNSRMGGRFQTKADILKMRS